jgi:hypothetical protein
MTFGKYRDKTVAEIAAENPGYLEWCLDNLDHFHLTEETLAEIRRSRPRFAYSAQTAEALARKDREMARQQNAEKDDEWVSYPIRRRWNS